MTITSRSVQRQELKALYRHIGRAIHSRRAERKMSLEQLARRSRFSAAWLDRMETGCCEVRLYHLARIAAALEIAPEALLGVGENG